MRELEILLENWKKEHEEKGYRKFISDGIVNYNKWEKQSTPKVCYFLKEAYDDTEGKGFNLSKKLNEEEPWGMWKKVAIWTQAIYNSFSRDISDYPSKDFKSVFKNVIQNIAVVNIKKSNGEKSSNDNDLQQFINLDKEKIKREIELINPDIIICGKTFKFLKQILDDIEIYDNSLIAKWKNVKWKNILIIDYYHPAGRYPNKVNYYSLLSIGKIAQEKYAFKIE